MNAPFHIGQKVVCLVSMGDYIKGEVVTVTGNLFCNKCSKWHTLSKDAMYPLTGIFPCSYCGDILANTVYRGMQSKFFAPLEMKYADATAEILEKFSSPNESPDKIIQPQKATV